MKTIHCAPAGRPALALVPSAGAGLPGSGLPSNRMASCSGRADELPPLDLAAMVRVSEACKRASKLRTLAALRMASARIRLANLQRHLPA